MNKPKHRTRHAHRNHGHHGHRPKKGVAKVSCQVCARKTVAKHQWNKKDMCGRCYRYHTKGVRLIRPGERPFSPVPMPVQPPQQKTGFFHWLFG